MSKKKATRPIEIEASMSAQDKLELLQQQYLLPIDRWYDDNVFPPSDWRLEVANDDTRLGYMEWLWHKYEDLVDEEERKKHDGDRNAEKGAGRHLAVSQRQTCPSRRKVRWVDDEG